MPELSQFAFFLAITPGPGLFYVAARSLAGGRAEGFASGLVSVALNTLAAAMVALGIGLALARRPSP